MQDTIIFFLPIPHFNIFFVGLVFFFSNWEYIPGTIGSSKSPITKKGTNRCKPSRYSRATSPSRSDSLLTCHMPGHPCPWNPYRPVFSWFCLWLGLPSGSLSRLQSTGLFLSPRWKPPSPVSATPPGLPWTSACSASSASCVAGQPWPGCR